MKCKIKRADAKEDRYQERLLQQPYGRVSVSQKKVTFWKLPKKDFKEWCKLSEYYGSEKLNSPNEKVVVSFDFGDEDQLQAFLEAIHWEKFPVTEAWGTKGYRSVPKWALSE